MKSIRKAAITQFNKVIKAYKRHFDPKFLKSECERCLKARAEIYEYLEQIDYDTRHKDFKKVNDWIKKLDKYFTDWGCHDISPWNKFATRKGSRNRKSNSNSSKKRKNSIKRKRRARK